MCHCLLRLCRGTKRGRFVPICLYWTWNSFFLYSERSSANIQVMLVEDVLECTRTKQPRAFLLKPGLSSLSGPSCSKIGWLRGFRSSSDLRVAMLFCDFCGIPWIGRPNSAVIALAAWCSGVMAFCNWVKTWPRPQYMLNSAAGKRVHMNWLGVPLDRWKAFTRKV